MIELFVGVMLLAGVGRLVKGHITNLCRGVTTYQREHQGFARKRGLVSLERHRPLNGRKVNDSYIMDADDHGAQTISLDSEMKSNDLEMAANRKQSARNSLKDEDEEISESFFGVSGAMQDCAVHAAIVDESANK